MSTLRLLSGVQHALLVVLLGVGVARSIVEGTRPLAAGVGAGLFLAAYLVGVAKSRKATAHADAGALPLRMPADAAAPLPGPAGSAAPSASVFGSPETADDVLAPSAPLPGVSADALAPSAPSPGLTSHVPASPAVPPAQFSLAPSAPSRTPLHFLVVLTAAWVVLVAISPHFVWVGFSLWLLAGHFLPWGGAVVYTVATLGVIVAVPCLEGAQPSVGEIVGPVVGSVFALVMSRGQVELARDARERARLIHQLLAAQEEADKLAAQLATAERAAGVAEERARLSRDIHDTLAQGFSSLVLLARSGAKAEDVAELRGTLARMEATAEQNLAEARRVVADLAPRDLGDAGLAATLRRAVEMFVADTGVDAQFRLEAEGGATALVDLPTIAQVALLRTAQGALANVRDHARASRVVVTLSDVGDGVRLDVVDDGAGFDPDADVPCHKHTGFGLAGMRARIAEVGGTLTVESEPGFGTALSVGVPGVLRGGGALALDSAGAVAAAQGADLPTEDSAAGAACEPAPVARGEFSDCSEVGHGASPPGEETA